MAKKIIDSETLTEALYNVMEAIQAEAEAETIAKYAKASTNLAKQKLLSLVDNAETYECAEQSKNPTT